MGLLKEFDNLWIKIRSKIPTMNTEKFFNWNTAIDKGYHSKTEIAFFGKPHSNI